MTPAAGLPWLVAIPFAGAAIVPIAALRGTRAVSLWTWGVVVATGALATMLVTALAQGGRFEHAVGGWAAPYGITLRFDAFGAWVLPMCLLFALIVPYLERSLRDTLPKVDWAPLHALLLANLGGMIGFAISGDLFNLFVFMEIVALSSYALVAVGGRGAAAWAALEYLMIGAVSSLLMLLGVALIFAWTGSLDLLDVADRVSSDIVAGPAMTGFALLATSFLVKAALFPLHAWLPGAHAIAPSAVSAVLSGMVVKVGLIGMLRLYQLAERSGAFGLDAFQAVLVALGSVSIVMGAFLAMFQDDVKLMLAYSTISNVGYIVLGLGLASPYALLGAAVHVFNHALIKTTLFLAVGALIHGTGRRTLHDLRGVARAMPYSAGAVAIGAIAIVGLPPTAGFVCKWYIALGAFQAGDGAFGAVLIFGALFIFVYFVRMVNAFYFQTPVHPEVRDAREAPWAMRTPLLILAALCLVMGVLGGIPIGFVEPAIVDLLPAWGP